MKLLFMVDAFSGGAGNVIQILARAFRDRGHNCAIMLLNGRQVAPKYDLTGIDTIDFNLHVHSSGRTPFGRIASQTKALKGKLAEINPDAIISFITMNNIMACLARPKGAKLIVSERNDPFHKPSADKRMRRRDMLWEFLRKRTYGRADRIVVQCSNFCKFDGGKFLDSTVVIPNPILEPPVQYDAGKRNAPYRFINVSRLTRQKNFPWMLERMAEIHRRVPDSELVIYGEGDMRPMLEEIIHRENMGAYVTLAGYTDDPYPHLAAGDAYLMSSDYEGFPNSLSEAMAIGLPSVSRMCHEGLRDLVTDGENGFLVAPDDADSFVERAVALVKDEELRKRMSEEARKVCQRYSVEKITDMWEALIEEIRI